MCHGFGGSASTSLITIADSAKHVVQILELLDERKMIYAFPINKTELLLSSGFSLLWQSFELSQDSKLAKDNQKSLKALTNLLMAESPIMATEFKSVIRALVATDLWPPSSTHSLTEITPRLVCEPSCMPAPEVKSKSTRRQLHAIASRFSSLTKSHHQQAAEAPRRATAPTLCQPCFSPNGRTLSQVSLSSTRSLPVFSVSPPPTTRTFMDLAPLGVNLDYLPLRGDVAPPSRNLPRRHRVASSELVWTPKMEATDISPPNMYGGLDYGVFQDQISQSRLELDVSNLSDAQSWLDQDWPASASNFSAKGPTPQSVLSGSEDSITSSCEEFSGCGSSNGSASSVSADHFDVSSKTFKGIAMPVVSEDAICS